MKIGLFFGSFNPVHIGHLAIANFLICYSDLSSLWFVVSPHNPLKDADALLDDNLRLEMLRLAVAGDPRFQVSDVEFRLERPSYTIHTLRELEKEFPQHTFVLVMGADGLESFDQWKDYQAIIAGFERYVYPRMGNYERFLPPENGRLMDAPLIEVSSTFIRGALSEKKDIRHFLPPGIFDFIRKNDLYSH